MIMWSPINTNFAEIESFVLQIFFSATLISNFQISYKEYVKMKLKKLPNLIILIPVV